MPRILCVHQGFELYGSDRMFVQSLHALARVGTLTIHLPRSGPLSRHISQSFENIIVGNLWVLRRSLRHSNWFAQLWRLGKSLGFCAQQVRVHDIVYLNTNRLLPYMLLAIFYRKKFIVHVHEIEHGLLRWLMAGLLWLGGARLVANSWATAATLPQSMDITVIHNGLPDRVVPVNMVPHTTLNLLLPGRINHWKGHTLALRAMALLHRGGCNRVRLRIVGDCFEGQAQILDRIKGMMTVSGLTDCVEIVPFSADMDVHYAWADLVLVPSTNPEPFGLVAIEAMRAELPVIAAGHGGLKEIVDPGKSGLLFKPCDVLGLMKSILEYVQKPGLLRQHGVQGRQRFLDLFQETTYNQAITDLVMDYAEQSDHVAYETLQPELCAGSKSAG